jgi:hypothetical protein
MPDVHAVSTLITYREVKMKAMKAVLCGLIALTIAGGSAYSGPKDQAEFDRIKALEGKWVGKTPDGQSVHITYKVVSAGTAVMESTDHSGMITMYHLNGDTLMLTHYCSVGNQPRMRLISSTPESLTFDMFDATNLASPNDGHMRGLVYTFKGKNHVSAEWIFSKDGRDDHHGVFDLKRMK